MSLPKTMYLFDKSKNNIAQPIKKNGCLTIYVEQHCLRPETVVWPRRRTERSRSVRWPERSRSKAFSKK
jgi:hypothetical protein